MSRDLYDCTAAELATGAVDHISYETRPADAASWLETNGYDAAPVYRDDSPVGFVHVDDVETDDDGETLETHLTPLTINDMISGDATFTAVLSALVESPVYFLGGHSHVSGILTRADLNTAPARIYLFDRITYLEESLRELILDKAPDWKNTPVTVSELDDIEERYEDAKSANVALDEIHYAQFSTLKTIVSNVQGCWQACGFTNDKSAGAKLDKITDLRNDVAHANLLVQNTDSNSFLNSGRTTENLYSTLETIEEVLEELHEAGYEPGSTDV